MVDFVKSNSAQPVGSALMFARGTPDRIETPTGEVWLKTGILETDKTKFDVNLWKKSALVNFVYSQTPIDTSTSAPRIFTQIAMGKANGKRVVLFTTANGNVIYGSYDNGATIVPVSTNDKWIGQMFVFWYKGKFYIQTASSGINSVSWDGTTLGEPVAESWLNTGLAGAYISCMDAIGDKLVLGTDNGKLFISSDGITLTPCSAWNDSASKTAVDTCGIKDVAISKTTDSIAAVGWSSTKSMAFISQVENAFSGVGAVLKYLDTGLTVKDDTIINTAGRWISNIWTWVNDPAEKVTIGTLTNTVSSSTTGPVDHVELDDQMFFCSRDSSTMYLSANNVFNYSTTVISYATNAIYNSITGILYKVAIDVEDRVVVSLSSTGNRVCRNFGIVAGTLVTNASFTHVRIK